ncbi:MAG: hypothetical protein DSY32_02980 [Aquifex sp.]|nr:MAG: hypothetical protein DSY32_02980 [Aquifex sp.]
MDVSVGIEASGYFTASDDYSLKVVPKEDSFSFSIIGFQSAQRNVRKVFIPHMVGALNLLGLGIWTGREVCDGVYVENSKRTGFTKIRVLKKDKEKVYIEIPNFEAISLSNFILSYFDIPYTYTFLDSLISIAKEEGVYTIISKSKDITKEAVFDRVGLGKLSGLIKEAVLGKLGRARKVISVKGYAIVDVEFNVLDREKQEVVNELKEKVKELARKQNTYWIPMLRNYLAKNNIDYRTYVSVRFGSIDGEDRTYITLPLPHAWGLSLCFDKLCLNLTS